MGIVTYFTSGDIMTVHMQLQFGPSANPVTFPLLFGIFIFIFKTQK